ncbi:MAG: hypothetical protein H0T43_01145 [Solirubrobacterales bacterium]|nr:hypothetical protein [Solirubrobacterales bacterium]
MSIGVEHEAPRADAGPGFSDAVTFAFGDSAAAVYGIARVGLAGGGGSGLAVLFADSEAVAASAEGAVKVDVHAWESVRAAGVSTTVQAPLQAWTADYEGDEAGFALRFEAVSAPAVLQADAPVARAGGMQGYEQLCAVTGTARIGAREVRIDCLGQRGHLWGTPDWERIELARTLCAWLGEDRAVTLTAVRPAAASNHADEEIAAWLLEGGEPVAVADPRLSTTYDARLRQRRAGLELWSDDEGAFARRAAGEVLCGTTLDLGRLRLDTAFFAWRMEGRTGVGRYDVLRRSGGSDGDHA